MARDNRFPANSVPPAHRAHEPTVFPPKVFLPCSVQVQRAFDLCKEHGWTPPAVYQGLYNPLNRLVEEKLLPVLRANNCAFVAYNPLAAGLLTGKHLSADAPAKGRFLDNPNYLPRFFTPPNFEAVGAIRTACAAASPPLSLVEATYRWLLHGSALDASRGDGILIGASSLAHAVENLAACAVKEHLPAPVQAAFDGAYALVQEGAFPYWRSYSADHPNREALDQGASYAAAKK